VGHNQRERYHPGMGKRLIEPGAEGGPPVQSGAGNGWAAYSGTTIGPPPDRGDAAAPPGGVRRGAWPMGIATVFGLNPRSCRPPPAAGSSVRPATPASFHADAAVPFVSPYAARPTGAPTKQNAGTWA
jgi:hypothetical protein